MMAFGRKKSLATRAKAAVKTAAGKTGKALGRAGRKARKKVGKVTARAVKSARTAVKKVPKVARKK
jgi:hypothetical protein